MIQATICITGVVAIWLTQQHREAWKKYACFPGLIGQPFWIYAAYQADQWGILILAIGYAYVWWLGFKNNWLRSDTAFKWGW